MDPAVAEPELVVHLFARATGPDAEPGYAELRAVWDRCGEVLGMTGDDIPATAAELPGDPGEVVVATRRRPDALHQAILRRFPAVVNLSVVLSPGRDWIELDTLRRAVTGPWSGALLGAAYLFLGKYAVAGRADPDLAAALAPSLPAPGPAGWWHDGVVSAGGFAVWEPDSRGSDGRAERRFLILADPGRDDELSDWTWSNGSPVLPPLGRHLRHAATVRHQVRVWQRADGLRRVQDRLDAGEPPAGVRRDIAYWQAHLRDMRQSTRNSATAMREALGPDADRGPLADDLALAGWFRRALKDDLTSLAVADDRAARLAELPGETSTMPNTRDVFVIHGRDTDARRALQGFLHALDLRPMDWEAISARAEGASPYVGEVLARAFELNQAAVVLMTPDDGAVLHEQLRVRGESAVEKRMTGQVRPEVLFRAGMALALQRARTVIVEIGELRPVPDLAGIDTIKFDGTAESLLRIAKRLERAGCAVDTSGTDWLDTSRFTDLTAYDRTF